MTNSTYEASTIRDVELHMLTRLQWNLVDYTSVHFLRYFLSRDIFLGSEMVRNSTLNSSNVSRYVKKSCYHILGVCQAEYQFEKFLPSVMAMSLILYVREGLGLKTTQESCGRIFGVKVEDEKMPSLMACLAMLRTYLDEQGYVAPLLKLPTAPSNISPRGVSDLWTSDNSRSRAM